VLLGLCNRGLSFNEFFVAEDMVKVYDSDACFGKLANDGRAFDDGDTAGDRFVSQHFVEEGSIACVMGYA